MITTLTSSKQQLQRGCCGRSKPCHLAPPARRAALGARTRLASPRAQAAQTLSSQDTLDTRVEMKPDLQHWVAKCDLGSRVNSIQEASALPQIWDLLADCHGGEVAMVDPHSSPPSSKTFSEAAELIRQFASGLQALGIMKGDRVTLFSENSSRWMIADQGIMLCGGVDAVRGVTSIPTDELKYILQLTESSGLVVQDPGTLDRLLPTLAEPESAGVRFVVMLWGEPTPAAHEHLGNRVQLLTFDQLLEIGANTLGNFEPPPVSREDLATYCFTSGTTGHPKAVLLTHDNLLSQIEALEFMAARPGQCAVTYLPPWHMYGRTLEYFLYSRAVAQVYSNLRRLKEDLERFQPDIFISVPLMLANLHAKALQIIAKKPPAERKLAEALLDASRRYIQALRVLRGVDLHYAKEPPSAEELQRARITAAALAPVHRLAGRLVYSDLRRQIGIRGWAISGGGSLSTHLDDFFEIIGLPVMIGYGLTETSPVLSLRHKGFRKNVRGTIGPAIPGIDLNIVDPKTKQDLPDGEQGLIMARGPAVMKGYYHNEAAMKEAFPLANEWFDTGDLGWMVPRKPWHNMGGSIVITGRAKDTIVLTSGENIEPQPLEDLVQASPIIKFCVLLGHRVLGALIVPDREALESSTSSSDTAGSKDENGAGGGLSEGEVRALVHGEITKALAGRPARERVSAFEIVEEEFSIENGTLTRTMKPRRKVIMQKYRDTVSRLERQLQ